MTFIARIAFILFVTIVSVFALVNLTGDTPFYIVFSLLFNYLLFLGFDKHRSFFDLFIGLFFWIGFWLKYSLKVAFLGGLEGYANFNASSPAAHNKALLISSIAASALIIASLVRRRFFSYEREGESRFHFGLYTFYVHYRKWCVAFFMFMACLIPFINGTLGIYQRGSVPRTILPFGLNGVFTWLILFGLSAFFATIFNFEIYKTKKISIWYVCLGLTEIFFSNFSMLSRGLILNSSSLFFGINKSFKRYNIKGQFKFNISLISVIVLIMLSSVFAVNYIRSHAFYNNEAEHTNNYSIARVVEVTRSSSVLFLDRWVGIDGVMSISSYNKLGLDLWNKAWKEKFKDNGTSFYDTTIIKSSYTQIDLSNKHFISLPGIVGFIFYLGNYYYLFSIMLCVGLIGSIIEVFVFRFGGNNILLCSLIAQVVAYRFVHFGYSPAQTYLLFVTIFGNVLIFYVTNFFLMKLNLVKLSEEMPDKDR